MTPDMLKSLRAQVPDCDLIVYADLGSRTVLSADSALRYPQEHLDALCHCAADLFGAATGSDTAATEQVLFFGPTGGRGFFRNLAEPGEALCCICAAGTDIDALTAAFTEALAGAAGPA